MSARRLHYDAALKRKVIAYAEKNGNRAAGRKFDVNEANIRRWRIDRTAIFTCGAATKSFRGPKTGRYPQVDDAVLQFVEDECAKGIPITRRAIQLKAREISTSLGIENFKAERGWCDRFMRRAGLAGKQLSTISQEVPAELEQKLLSSEEISDSDHEST